ncbi:MAG: DUF523 and DUF1722 domain-containing protein [Myxococcota bacterium]
MPSATSDMPLRLGISACLLGETVRYDGGHKRDPFLSDRLASWVEWVPVCPELEAGLGVPRPPMHLVGQGQSIRLLERESGRDHTRTLQRFSTRRIRELRALELAGYVFKMDSPSCGIGRVPVSRPRARPQREGRGLFAAALCDALPGLPVEDEGRLQDPLLRENFIERSIAFARLRELFRGRWTARRVAAFQQAHELQLLAHSPSSYRALQQQLAALAKTPRAAFRARYHAEFMAALAKPASPTRTASALRRAARHFEGQLPPRARRELSASIDAYRAGDVPLRAPLVRIRRHVRELSVTPLEGQTFLEARLDERLRGRRA